MPAPVHPQQLQAALSASVGEMEGFRHGGPGSSPIIQNSSFGPQQPHQDLSGSGDNTFYQSQHSAGVRGVRKEIQLAPASMAPPPTLYVKKCSKCDWSSIPTYDANAYSGAVSDYDSHMREFHHEPTVDKF